MRTAINWTFILVVTLTLSTTLLMAEEKIYRWVDADGVVHFGDQPNDKFDSEQIEVKKGPEYVPSAPQQASAGTETTTGADSGDEEVSYAQQRRDLRAKQRQEAAEKKQEVAARCEMHQKLVTQLEPMTRVIVQREDGSVERMDDNERLAQLKKSKDFIAENCGH